MFDVFPEYCIHKDIVKKSFDIVKILEKKKAY